MKRKIVFFISLIVLILSLLILSANAAINVNKYMLIFNSEGFVPKLELNEWKDVERKKIDIKLEDLNSIKHIINGSESIPLNFLVEDNAKENKLSYDFYGDYTFKDGNLVINEKNPLNQGFYTPLTISLKEDFYDFNEEYFWNVFSNELIEKIKGKHKLDYFVPNISDYFEKKELRYIIIDSESILIFEDLENNNYENILELDKENERFYLRDLTSNDSIENQGLFLNDGHGVEAKFDGDVLIIKDVEKNKEYKIIKGDEDDYEGIY